MARERAVADTNVVVSGLLLPRSAPGRCLDHLVQHGQLVASTTTLRELISVFGRSKFDRYVSASRRQALLQRFVALLDIVEVVQHVRAVRDPKDDAVLDVAINGRASIVVTGDRDLLALHPFRSVSILTPSQYLRQRT